MKAMKVIFGFLCVVFFPILMYGQLSVSYQFNLDIYKPYTQLAQEYKKLNSSLESRTQTAFASYPVLKRGKNTLGLGVNYKRIDHIVKNRVLYVPLYYASGSTHSFIGNYPRRADLKSHSNYLGLHFFYKRNLFEKGIYQGSFGAVTELYLVEFFKSEYYFYEMGDHSDAPFPNEYESYLPLEPLNGEERNLLKPSLSTLSFYYLNTFQLANKFSLGMRVSVGTNLYSKWDQFSRYAWVGLGLEFGFGKHEERKPE